MVKLIQEMPVSSSNYFRYFPLSRQALQWGVAVTAAGRTHVAANSAYPIAQHPADHTLDWTRGRILDALQVVLIIAGRGWLETAASKPRLIDAGSAFMLFPQVWHRYRPETAVGWVESWVELSGPTIQELLRQKTFSPKQPVLSANLATGLESALDRVHARARVARIGTDPELATRGLAVLAEWKTAETAPRRETRLGKAMESAERYLAAHMGDPVNIAEVARRAGIAYSHFRHVFRLHTGYSPWQYVVHLRLTQGKRMLAGSDATLDEIAARIGFSSGFHFSSAFKRVNGLSPRAWRQIITRKSGTTRKRS